MPSWAESIDLKSEKPWYEVGDYWISIDIGKWIRMPDYSSARIACRMFSKNWGIPHYIHFISETGEHIAFKFVNDEYMGNV